MSTTILEAGTDGATFYLNEFWGGSGVMHQITTNDGYVQLTRAQMFELCAAFLTYVRDEAREKERENL